MTRASRPRSRLLPLVLAFALTCVAAHAGTAEPVGPPFGHTTYKGEVRRGPDGERDEDVFTARLVAGERLSVTVRSPFQSPLFPELVVRDPSGADRTAEAAPKSLGIGKKLAFRNLTLDATGLWTVTVRGSFDTEGPYSIAFDVAPPPAASVRADQLGGEGGASGRVAFEAVDGAQLDAAISWPRGSAGARIVAIEDPAGRPVLADGTGAADAARVGRKGAKLKHFPLSGGAGTYTLVLAPVAAPVDARVKLRVTPPPRPTGTKRLSDQEPHLTRPGVGTIFGVEGRRIRLDGWYFSTAGLPTVLFGTARGREVLVDPSGGFLEVGVPPGEDDTTVAVYVINPDGQGASQDDLFYYVPEPTLTGITDALGGPAPGGSTAGGATVRLQGTYFRSGQLVRFGDAPDVVPILRGAELELRTPPHAVGSVAVRIVDGYGHEAVAPFLYEFKDPPTFDSAPFAPAVARADGTTNVIVHGSAFEETDTLEFDGVPVAHLHVAATLASFVPPSGTDDEHAVEIVDRFGLRSGVRELRLKPAGQIASVAAIGGAQLGATEISVHGDALVRIDGTSFDVHDTVACAGSTIGPSLATTTRIEFTTRASTTTGAVDVRVTDAVGQSATATAALQLVGALDRTSTRAPARTSVDDRSALRAALGDLDGDGAVDDVVLVSQGSSPGTRGERLRLLVGGSGALADATATGIPAAGSDDWRGSALALGDVDATNGTDVLVAGVPPSANTIGELRLFRNGGSAVFSVDTTAVPGSTYRAAIVAVDEEETEHEVISVRTPAGAPTALVLGDLDGDGDLDVVMGRDRYESRHLGVDPAYVDTTGTPFTVSAADAAAYDRDLTVYYSATRVLENRLDTEGAFVDVTDDVLPSVGDSASSAVPAFHARDVALGDLDGDGDLDLVVAWDDPATVTPADRAAGGDVDGAQLATRILLNDGSGVFTDATSSWLPAGAHPEWYQASRILLVDLDGDATSTDPDLDLVLVHAQGVDAYEGPPGSNYHALRVLRNDGAGTGFTDVTSSAVPSLDTATTETHYGGALAVADLTGDGVLDLLVGTTTAPSRISGGARTRSLRLFAGTAGALAFRDARGFLPPRTTDGGECDDVLVVQGLAGASVTSLVLVSETAPGGRTDGAFLRVFDWLR